jgi:putative nucleotidyltransferase with HDIG domain
MPPGKWELAWSEFRRSEMLIRIGMAVCVSVLLCVVIRAWDPPFTYRAGHVTQRDIVARVPFKVVNEDATRIAREEAARKVRAIYAHDPQPLDQLLTSLQDAVAEVMAADSYGSLRSGQWEAFAPPADDAILPPAEDSRARFERFQASLAGDKGLVEFGKRLTVAFAPFREQGLLGLLAQKPAMGGVDEIVIHPVGHPETTRIVKLADIQIGQGGIFRSAIQHQFKNDDLADSLWYWLRNRINRTPSFTTLTWNEKETRKAIDAAKASLPDVVVTYQAGQTLAEANKPLTSEQVHVLRLEYEEAMEDRPIRQRVGRAGAMTSLILALSLICGGYIYRREPCLILSLRRLTMVSGLMIACVILAMWASSEMLRAELIPLLFFGQTLAIAYRHEVAILLSGIAALVITFALGPSLAHFLLLTGIVVTATLQLGRIRTRSKLIYVGLFSGFVAFPLTIVLLVLDNQPLAKAMLIVAACNALWTVAVGFLLTGVQQPIEKLFGVLTDINLLELGDVSHPLLQELVRRAPSTYNHSITVGSIAEAAAECIGARGLLVRIGAYYHDIGKMLKPGYFIENQSPEGSRHESLVPAMSTLVIIAHVKDGVDLARQHGLPLPIIQMIEQHHGTTLVEYFYSRATEQSHADPNGGEVDESLYRYPGPKPQTKEAGVLMLADSVESAVRSLVDPAPARIEGLVREVAERKLDDGQFDESGLTLRELRIIEDSMIKSLIANYHSRIKYPEQKTA